MPYITKEDRNRFVYHLTAVPYETVGELNFAITTIVQEYLAEHGEKYQTYNDILGALEGAKLELYRRKIVPYEDKKIEENGDVY